MKLKDRMELADPLWKAMASRLEAMITAINEMRQIVSGQNPHKVNDTADVITADGAYDFDSCVDLEQQIIDNYETHIGSTSYHTGADSTNVVTEVGFAKECYNLLNNLKAKYNLNRVNVTSHHGESGDETNVVAAADADTKAKAITLANEIKTDLLAHMALTAGSVHGAADAVNGEALAAIDDLEATATWTEIATMADAIRVAYVAHIAYTTSSVHAGADATNGPTVAAVGTVLTALIAGLTEVRADMIAHIAEFGTSHQVKDVSIEVSAAIPTTLDTCKTLANDLRSVFNDHISRADEIGSAIPSLELEE